MAEEIARGDGVS